MTVGNLGHISVCLGSMSQLRSGPLAVLSPQSDIEVANSTRRSTSGNVIDSPAEFVLQTDVNATGLPL